MNSNSVSSRRAFLDVGSDRGWFTITDLADLKAVGRQMNNALENEAFAKMYSERLDLYFLIDKNTDKVVVNASFEKGTNTPHMIVAQKNAKPEPKYTKDIDALIAALTP